MSQAAPRGRETPRWSVAGQFAPASRAGLPGRIASVSVVPPLSVSGPKSGAAVWSVERENAQSVVSERLWPRDVAGMAQFSTAAALWSDSWATLPATIELSTVTEPPEAIPAAEVTPLNAWFPVIVLLATVSVELKGATIPPPWPLAPLVPATLLLMVLSVTLSEPVKVIPPPLWPRLPEIVDRVIVSDPFELIPPPSRTPGA